MANQDTNYREKLELLDKTLTERVEKIKKDLYFRDQPLDPDFEEQAVEQENLDVLNELYRQGQEELVEIRAALERLQEQKFGQCERCNQAISTQRLSALPYTRYCKSCTAE